MKNYNEHLYKGGTRTWVRDEDQPKLEHHDRVEWFIDNEDGLTLDIRCNSYEHAVETLNALGTSAEKYTIRKLVTPFEKYYGFK